MLAFIPLLLLTYVLQVQCYCVQNRLSDKTPLRVIQVDKRINKHKLFNKLLYQDVTGCCDPNKSTCVVEGKEGVPVTFEIQFWWRKTYDRFRTVECVSGGNLYIMGTEQSPYAHCEYKGFRYTVPIKELSR
ncbi:hypothetical protein BDB01DRAFT_377483 [Pilobolus umbonatus]|nr:hypothetical protein BDB01DRAFT_377483 [Pilobolus umbonatus]